jgi:hypothetical protein
VAAIAQIPGTVQAASRAIRGVPGVVRGGVQAVKNLPQTIKGAAGKAKELNPFNIVGKQRDEAVKKLTEMGVTIDENAVLDDVLKAADDAPVTMKKAFEKYAYEAMNKFKNPAASLDDVLRNLNDANEAAFLQSGNQGRAAAAKFERVVGDALRKQIEANAPKVHEANQLFSKLFGIKRSIGKMGFPARIAGGTAVGRALAGLFGL